MAWSPARFDLATFTQVQVLGLTATDDALKGFNGGFASGGYGYVVPRHARSRSIDPFRCTMRCFAQSMTPSGFTSKF